MEPLELIVSLGSLVGGACTTSLLLLAQLALLVLRLLPAKICAGIGRTGVSEKAAGQAKHGGMWLSMLSRVWEAAH